MKGNRKHTYDVVVVGCGIAGLSAAVSALQSGASVAILERAPVADRGGNTRWTEALMRMKDENEVSDDFEEHFMANAGFHLDPSLVNATAQPYAEWPTIVRALSFVDPEIIGTFAGRAGPTLQWLKTFGVRFADTPTYLINQSTTRISPVGGGLALIEALAAYAENNGADFFYETTARGLIDDGEGSIAGVRAITKNGAEQFFGAVVLASGGFEGNAEMQARYFGPRARYIRPVARGGYYNKGEGIRMALDFGAAPCGDFTEFHAEPIDPRSGEPEPIVLVFTLGILVDCNGQRFVDEGSGHVDAIYEAVTRRINDLPGGIAYVLLDAKVDDVPNWRRTVRSDVPPITANSIAELAMALGTPVDQLKQTICTYNAATRPGHFDPVMLDGLATAGLIPPKSHWARPLDTPPYRAWPIMAANCFTFGGLKCDSRARVLDTDAAPIPGLYAAGETMGLYYGRYTGSTSVLRGAVFGRVAGLDAAARRQNVEVKAAGSRG